MMTAKRNSRVLTNAPSGFGKLFAVALLGSSGFASGTAHAQELIGPRPAGSPNRTTIQEPSREPSVDIKALARNERLYEIESDLTLAELAIKSREILRFVPNSLGEYKTHVAQAPAAVRMLNQDIISRIADPESELQQTAMVSLIKADGIELHLLSEAEQRAAIDRILSTMETLSVTEEFASLGLRHCRTILHSGNRDLAIESYRRLGDVFARQPIEIRERLVLTGQRMLGAAQRLEMVGSQFELQGNTVFEAEFDIQTWKGKHVLVFFWTTTSGPCEAELEKLQDSFQDLDADSPLQIVLISLDAKANIVRNHLNKNNLAWPCLLEEEAGWNNSWAVRYGVEQLPTSILVDPSGNVVDLEARYRRLTDLFPEWFESPQDEATAEGNSL